MISSFDLGVGVVKPCNCCLKSMRRRPMVFIPLESFPFPQKGSLVSSTRFAWLVLRRVILGGPSGVNFDLMASLMKFTRIASQFLRMGICLFAPRRLASKAVEARIICCAASLLWGRNLRLWKKVFY